MSLWCCNGVQCAPADHEGSKLVLGKNSGTSNRSTILAGMERENGKPGDSTERQDAEKENGNSNYFAWQQA
ncbi:Hypothetical predicted protein [Olea europaea subsp. europaea]|uniref:Uncharacterized protein n=1 Tax=Olea europaea subsp. europaea TaxID=158383 RepID=A0A8S0VLT0_OLEEU|nr:Hypothetical predicted protein [Olea europaea subsp. europaea]